VWVTCPRPSWALTLSGVAVPSVPYDAAEWTEVWLPIRGQLTRHRVMRFGTRRELWARWVMR